MTCIARITALFLAATTLGCVRAEHVLVASLVDDIVASDLVAGGNCHSGCTREEHATAHVSGVPETTNCELQTVTPFEEDVEAGLLTASIYCEDSTGALIEEGIAPCVFEVCVDFEWIEGDDGDGKLQYDVVIVRASKPRAAHTVYVDLTVAVDPSASAANADSCAAEGMCQVKVCSEPDPYSAQIALTDSYGDGWVGGNSNYNLWQLTDATNDSTIIRGTLADNHESATLKECLGDGDYIFNTTATAAFADEMGWSICETHGKAGEGVTFTVKDGECTNPQKVERATAEEAEDAELSYCSLPAPTSDDDYRTTTCTEMSSGLKVEGLAMYYDDRCNYADYSGCNARSIDACRLCFVDKELWMETYPNKRVPDWEECPCCVASVLKTVCTTDSSDDGSNKGVIIGVTVGLVGVIAIACCLSCAFGTAILRFIRRFNRRKYMENQLDLDDNVASAFPDSPGNGGATVRGHTHSIHRGRTHSGHFPIPRFDSIRGKFDAGIFASHNHGGAYAATASYNDGIPAEFDKKESSATMATDTSSPNGSNSPIHQRSTVLNDRLVTQGFTSSDVGRPISGAYDERDNGGGSGTAGWGIELPGEYPDLDPADPYAGGHTVHTGTNLED